MKRRYDLVVLGGGTGGLVASLIAAGIGAKVALVERDRTGGDCLWTGCVPSKSLLATAKLAQRMRSADDLGLGPVEPEIDFARVMDRVHSKIATIEPHDSVDRLRAEGVEVIAESGRFTGPRTIRAGERELQFRAAIVATGSAPMLPRVEGLADAAELLTTDSIWDLHELPRRLVVLGGGPIGCELGQAFARLGASVTLVEMGELLLPKEEPAASALIAERLRAEGVDVRLGAKATAVGRDTDGSPTLSIAGKGGVALLPFDRVLSATGRRPRSESIGLAEAGIDAAPSGAILVDERLRTSAPGIYAVGDVTGLLPFTHVAAHHARVATVNALFLTRRKAQTASAIPWVTFTDPEVARVGLTEQQARERWGEKTIIAESHFTSVDRAITDSETRGFTKLIGDKRGVLIGATIVGSAAGESIGELAARVFAGGKIEAISTEVHAYPTLSEGAARAADEMLRERFANPKWRAAAKPVLAALRLSRGG